MQDLILTSSQSVDALESATKEDYIIDRVSPNAVKNLVDDLLSRAFECAEDGNYSDALRLHDLALKEDPHSIRALVDKGVTLQNMGMLTHAVESYDAALAVSPDNLDALLNKGAALHSDQKYVQAIECYDKALIVDKKCAMAFAYKGLSLGEMGKLHDAIKYFKKALSIDSSYDLAIVSKNAAQELLKSTKEKTSKIR